MGVGTVNRNRGFWFGTETAMRWFPTPNRGADSTPQVWNAGGTLLNGGGYEFRSFGSHKQYVYEWPSSSAKTVAQLMKSYSDGSYGRGLIYFQDCTMFDTNVLPARIADPSMAADYEGGQLVYDVTPSVTPAASGPNNLPVFNITYDVSSVPVGFSKARSATFVPIPEGYSLVIGAVYTASGSGGLFVTKQNASGNLLDTVRLPELSAGGDLATTVISGVAGVWLWAGRDAPTAGSITVQAMTARLVDSDDAAVTTTTNYITNPNFAGSGTLQTYRTNYVTNPSFEVNTTGWEATSSATIARSTSTVYRGTGSLSVTTPGVVAGEGVRQTASTAAAGLVVAGRNAVGSAYVWAPAGVAMQFRLQRYNNTGATFVDEAVTNFTGTGDWQRVSASLNGLTTTNRYRPVIRTASATATTFYVDCVLVEHGTVSAQPLDYFDGAMAAGEADPDATYAFSGTAHASTSLMQFTLPAGFTNIVSSGAAVMTLRNGKPALRVISSVGLSNDDFPTIIALPATSIPVNGVYFGTMDVPTAPVGTGNPVYPPMSLGVDAPSLDWDSAPPAAGTHSLRLTLQGGTAPTALFVTGHPDPGESVYLTDVMLSDNPSYSGPAFSGDTPSAGATSYSWTGAANNSTSVATTTPRSLATAMSGPWIGGQGHSGCRFVGAPTYIHETGVGGGTASFAATFREVGSWARR